MAKPPSAGGPRKGARSLEELMRGSMKPAQPAEVATPKPAVEAAPEEAPAGNGAAPPKKLPYLNTIVTADDHDRIKMLALQKRLSVQKLGIRAWNLLLREEGMPELDAQAANRPSGRKSV